MKLKLKDGKKLSDVPRFSGVYKRICSMLSSKDVVSFDSPLPDGWDDYFEEASTPKPKIQLKPKGDK
jgi:hypothetical protein